MPDIDMLEDSSDEEASLDGLSTISSEEEQRWYTVRYGRRFHAVPSMYCLPHDEAELARLDIQHHMLKLLKGSNYSPPLGDILRRSGRTIKRVLDIGSGTGIWVEEMCEEFPEVRCIGIDIVPTATRYPPENGRFECYDVGQDGLRNADASVDVVHMRFTAAFIRDVPGLLADVARVLKPGGLIMFVEMDPVITASDGSLASGASIFYEFWEQALNACRDHCGIDLRISSKLQGLLTDSGPFTGIHLNSIFVPIGPWTDDARSQQIGEMTQHIFMELAWSLRPLLLMAGRTEHQVDSMIYEFTTYLANMGVGPQLLACYHTIWAVKRI